MAFGETLGMVVLGENIRYRPVQVRYSSDKSGKTLSLSQDDDGVMITVPFEYVERLIKKEQGK